MVGEVRCFVSALRAREQEEKELYRLDKPVPNFPAMIMINFQTHCAGIRE